jgi:colanic acid/amylovoran biosynthesis glycosyltransferase
VYLGAEIPEAACRYSERITDCRFACVGRLVPCKGHETLLQAFRLVLDELPAAELHVFGDGPLSDRLHWVLERSGLRSAVYMHGEVPNSKLVSRLEECEVVVLSSQVDDAGKQEGLPISLTEAAALGLPCVATRCGGIPEIVHHDETGLLVQQRNPEQLAHAMLGLARDPDLRRRLGSRARQMCIERFDARTQLREVVDLYRAAIAAQSALRGSQRILPTSTHGQA